MVRQEDLLRQGMQQIGLLASEQSIGLLITYINLLLEQNRATNLTAINDPLEAVTKHLVDSLSVEKYVLGTRVVDVGSGGGCPGIPLAIVRPKSHFVLVESKNKKADFLNRTAQALDLENITVICQRAENVNLKNIDTIICRALGSISCGCCT